MNKRVKHDDGNLIWFNYTDINWDELNNSGISNFDIENIPSEIQTNAWGIQHPVVIDNDVDKLTNYFLCYFEDKRSTTGYSCMCINKNKEIYKSHAGYDKAGIPVSDEY